MQTQSFSSIMGKGCMSRNALECFMLSVLPKVSKVVENNGFFQFLNISDVSFQFFDEYYENVEFKCSRCFVESWIGINSVTLLC